MLTLASGFHVACPCRNGWSLLPRWRDFPERVLSQLRNPISQVALENERQARLTLFFALSLWFNAVADL